MQFKTFKIDKIYYNITLELFVKPYVFYIAKNNVFYYKVFFGPNSENFLHNLILNNLIKHFFIFSLMHKSFPSAFQPPNSHHNNVKSGKGSPPVLFSPGQNLYPRSSAGKKNSQQKY